MCKLVLDTVRTVEDDSRMKTIDIKRYAHVAKVPRGEIEQSQTLNGIMLNKDTSKDALADSKPPHRTTGLPVGVQEG